jgi:hypothetical protein
MDLFAPSAWCASENVRQELAPAGEDLREGLPAALGSIVADCIGTDEQGQPDGGEMTAQQRVPQWRAFRTRRQVAAT